jgi:hypothetical protein
MNEQLDSLINLLSRMLIQQERQTALLELMTEQQGQLIQALAEDQDTDPDAEPSTYLDGTPCR